MEEFKTETRIYKIIPPTELYRPLRPRSEYLLDAVVNFKMAEEIRTILMWLLKDFQ